VREIIMQVVMRVIEEENEGIEVEASNGQGLF
jgi:hypothetical protein